MRGAVLALLLGSLAAVAAPPAVPLCELPHASATQEEQPFSEEVQRALDALVRAELAREPHAGLAVGVLHGGHRWVGAYGLRDVEHGLPATARTTWRMASITKSFTAVAVMQLVEQGKLQLDADIRTWVPAWPERPWPVTVRELLGHLGGVTNYGRFGPSHDTGPMDTAGAVALVAGYELESEPGTRFNYSTWGYNLLGAAVEAASGEPYGDYLQAHVFGPSGMVHAAMDERRTRDEHHAAGYRLSNGKLVPSRVIDLSGRFAGGGTRASIEDLLSFGGALLDYRLVSRESTGRMQTSMSTRDGRLTDYGMGFATYPFRGHYVVAHSGAQPETSTLLLLLPGEDVAIALASNVEGQAAPLRRIALGIVELLLEDGAPRLSARLQDGVDSVVNEGLGRVFGYGLAYHQWATHGPGTLPEEGRLAQAFERTSALLDRNTIAREPTAALDRIHAAHEPREDWLFVRVGAHMARTLEEALGPERLREYPARGALAFFKDYLAVCEAKGCPEPFRFTETLRADVRRFAGNTPAPQATKNPGG